MVLLCVVFIVLNCYLIHISNLSLKHLISTFICLIFLLLFYCLTLTSFMLVYHSINILLFLLLKRRLLSIHIQNIMIDLNRPVNPNYLPLKSNFNYIHIDIHCIFIVCLILLVLRLLIYIYSHW